MTSIKETNVKSKKWQENLFDSTSGGPEPLS